MPTVDDELTRRFRRAERPVDGDSVFEGLGVRRSHRERLRRIQVGVVTFAVLVATVAGFSVLTDLFDPAERGVMASTPYGSIGAIVACSDGRGGQLCRIDAEALARGIASQDLVRITDFSSGQVTSLSVSPDGSTVVFEHHVPGGETNRSQTAELWTIGIDGTGLTQITPRGSGYVEPSWSSAGLIVAVASDDVSQDTRSADLVILDPSSDTISEVRGIDLPGLTFPSSPQWIPGGERILFRAEAGSRTDLYTVAPDGSQLTNITNGHGSDYLAPRMSPDGRSIAYWVGSPNGVEIRICSLECVDSRTLSDPDGRPIYGDFPVWSPDGSWIAFQVATGPGTDLHIARIDGSDERVLGGGISEIAWIPALTRGTTPTPEHQPRPEGRDIGLGFNLCHSGRLGGIDLLGGGEDGFAWVGVPTRNDGTCPANPSPTAYVAAADTDGDGRADMWSDLPWRCDVLCTPYAAADLDGDGSEELIVASYFSIMDYHVMKVEEYASGGMDIRPVLVAEPGHPPADVIAGEPLRIDAGGDEGYGAEIVCSPPAITWTSVYRPVDSPEPAKVHIVELELLPDGMFHVVGTNDYELPVGEPSPLGDHTEPTCGVDWHPNA